MALDGANWDALVRHAVQFCLRRREVTDRNNPVGNSDFTRMVEALALGITNRSTPNGSDDARGAPSQTYGSDHPHPCPNDRGPSRSPGGSEAGSYTDPKTLTHLLR